ncbi:MAG: hypothetical protein ACK5W8_01885 [Pseudanabaena sp.]
MKILFPPVQIPFATIFTPQGDGNILYFGDLCLQRFQASPRYLPRKGTETVDRFLALFPMFFSQLRHDIYPARRRKLVTSFIL